MNIRFLLTVAACAVTSLIIIGGCSARTADQAGQSRTSNQAGRWTQDYDAQRGFTVEHPAGWTVQAQGNTILIQSADRSSLVLVEAFPVKPGETAKARVSSLSAAHPTLFPAARFDRIAQQPSQVDQAIGALSYRNARGQAQQARVLCLVYQGSGMLYALSAPNDRFTNDRAALLRILMSIRFGVKSAGEAATARNSARGGAEAGGSLRFVRWTDPKEHSYSVEVPQGWKVEGGAYRVANTDFRLMTRVTAPGNDMLVQDGDENLPTFEVPTPFEVQMHGPEGTVFSINNNFIIMLLRYMPAPQFNKWYMNKALTRGIDSISIVKEEEMAAQAREESAAYTKTLPAGQQGEITIAMTAFTGRSKETGKPIVGALFSRVRVTSIPSIRGPFVTWIGRPAIMLCYDDDKVQEHRQMTQSVLNHFAQSYRDDPTFTANFQQQVNSDTAAANRATMTAVEQSKVRTAEIARNAETTRQAIMGSYWAKQGAQSDVNRKFSNYIGDNADVTDPNTGRSYKVGSGYSNYYLDSRSGTIVGTNSANRPPVDFTPLTEF